jgi:uncharacterized protein DUF4410
MRSCLTVLLVSVIVLGASTPGPTAAQGQTPVRTVKGGVLDEINLYTQTPPSAVLVVIRPFSATDADIVTGDKKDETRKMQSVAPRMLAEEFVAKLKETKTFPEVSVLDGGAAPAGALLVEGKFTEMDPGSRAKRYLVGFGSGKSGVTAEGSVKTADGTLLATFTQRRIGVMGVAGGDSMKKLEGDTKNIGEDLARFLSAWATGKKLK